MPIRARLVAGSYCGVTVTVFCSLFRSKTISHGLPADLEINSIICSWLGTGIAVTDRILSPGCNPAAAAGLPLSTVPTTGCWRGSRFRVFSPMQR